MGMCPLLLLSLLFLLFLLFLSISLYLLCMSFYLAVTDIPKGPKYVADPIMPTILISTIPTAPLPWSPVISLPSYFLQLKSSLSHSSLPFIYYLKAYAIPYVLFQVCLLLKWLRPLSLRLVAILPPFLTLWVRQLPSLPDSTKLRPMTLTLQTSRVLDPLMLIFMAFEYLRSVSPVWKQSIVATKVSCRDSFLVVLRGNTSSSY